MQKLTTLLLFLCAWTHNLSAQSGLQMFDETYVHEIRIKFDEPNFWDTLTVHYLVTVDTNLENIPLPALVTIDGTTLDSVGVTQKGYYSNWGAGASLKKPLKLDFNDFVDGEYDNLKSINLQNAFMDPTLMRDMLSYRILREMGVAAPRSSYARIYINDDYWGLYVVVESVNKTFLKEHFGNNDGNLYKANYTSLQYLGTNQDDYSHDFELKTNETANDWSRLIRFIKTINNTPNGSFKDSLERHFELNSYFKSLAVDVTTNNWDSHFEHGRNFYLYDSPADGKFHWIPWDYNLAFAGGPFNNYDITLAGLRSNPDYDKILPKRVLNNNALRAQYLEIACDLHNSVFTPEHLNPIIETTKALIYNDLEDDPNKFYPEMEDFEIAVTEGIQRIVTDSFHLVDSFWNGTIWEHIDTVFVWEYEEYVPGLQSLIAERNASIRAELSDVYGLSCATPTGEPLALSFDIWPNPASEWLSLHIPEPGTITLFDVNGRIRKRTSLDQTDIKIPLQEFDPGVYWIEYATDKERSTRKMVVQR